MMNETMINETQTPDTKPLTMAALLDQGVDQRSDLQMDGSVPSDRESPMVLFPASEAEAFRQNWHSIQGSFVDTPREAVQRADELVATVIKHMTELFAGQRSKLEADWTKGNEVSTEDLRQALRRYRSFMDRLLSV